MMTKINLLKKPLLFVVNQRISNLLIKEVIHPQLNQLNLQARKTIFCNRHYSKLNKRNILLIVKQVVN